MARISPIKKRSVKVGKRLTSITLEDEFWDAVREIAQQRDLPLSNLLADINKQRTHANLSSVIRLLVLEHYSRSAHEAAKAKR